MSRKREGTGTGSLKDAIAKAWRAFEAPAHQERIAAESEDQAVEANLKAQKARFRKLLSWGVPKLAARVIVYEEVQEWSAVTVVRELAAATLLVLSGNPGSGKTVAACTRIEERERGLLVRAADLVELGDSWSDRDRIRSLGTVGVLVVDDLGVEYRNDKMICRLDGLLDTRTANALPTIITTNLPSSEFHVRYEDRIWSRIKQFGDYWELDDPDLRVTPIGYGRRP